MHQAWHILCRFFLIWCPESMMYSRYRSGCQHTPPRILRSLCSCLPLFYGSVEYRPRFYHFAALHADLYLVTTPYLLLSICDKYIEEQSILPTLVEYRAHAAAIWFTAKRMTTPQKVVWPGHRIIYYFLYFIGVQVYISFNVNCFSVSNTFVGSGSGQTLSRSRHLPDLNSWHFYYLPSFLYYQSQLLL